MQIPHNDSLDNIVNTDFTFEVFVYIINSQNTDMPIYTTNTDGANPNFQIYVDNSNRLQVGYVNGGGDENLITLSEDILVSRYSWHHIAFTFTQSSGQFEIWLDGQNSNTGISATIQNAADAINIGYRKDNEEAYFHGYMSNLRVVTGTIDGASLLYTDEFTPSTSNLNVVTNTKLMCIQEPFLLTDLSDTPNTINNINGVCPALKDPFKLPNSFYLKGKDNSYVSIPYNVNLYWYTDTYTLECFIYLLDTPVSKKLTDEVPLLVGNMDSNSVTNDWSFGPNKNFGLTFYYYNGSENYINTEINILKTHTWYHIAFTFNGSNQIKLWIDGNEVKSATVSGTPQNNNTTFVIGNYNSNYFKGYISNLRITNLVLYADKFTPETSNLEATADTQLLTFVNSMADLSQNKFVLTAYSYTDYCCSYASPFISKHENNPSIMQLTSKFQNTGEGIDINQDSTNSNINLSYSNGSKSLGTIKTTHTIKMQLYQSYVWIEGVVGGVGSWYNQNKDKIYKVKDFEDINVVNLSGNLNLESLSNSFVLSWSQYNNYDYRFPESNNKQYSINSRIYNNFKTNQYFDDSSEEFKKTTYSNFNKDFFIP